MTKNIVFDSYALITHFLKEKGHETISELLSEISIDERHGFLSLINLGEIFYILYRRCGQKDAEHSLHIIKSMPVEIVEPDYEMTVSAALLKARNKISYADAFAAALTIAKKATLVTGDKEFKHLMGETHFKVEFI